MTNTMRKRGVPAPAPEGTVTLFEHLRERVFPDRFGYLD